MLLIVKTEVLHVHCILVGYYRSSINYPDTPLDGLPLQVKKERASGL